MPDYAIFGLRLRSEIELPGLPPAETDGAPATLRLAPPRPLAPRWVLDSPRPGGEPWLSTGFADGRAVLRFHRIADVIFAAGSLDFEALPLETDALPAIFADHVLPRALAAAGRTVLHASAVATAFGAAAFLGESGSGKSTLAAAFSGAGAQFLADDAVLLDEALRVVPGPPVARLRSPSPRARAPASPQAGPAERGARRRIAVPPGPPAAAPLRAIFALAPPRPAVEIAPLSGAERVLALVRETFRLDPTDAASAAAEFRRLAALAEAVPVVRLALPRSLGALPDAWEKTLDFLRKSFEKTG